MKVEDPSPDQHARVDSVHHQDRYDPISTSGNTIVSRHITLVYRRGRLTFREHDGDGA